MDLSKKLKKEPEGALKDPSIILSKSSTICQKDRRWQNALREALVKYVKELNVRNYTELQDNAPQIAKNAWDELNATGVLIDATEKDLEDYLRAYKVFDKEKHVALFHTNHQGRPADTYYKEEWRPKVALDSKNDVRDNKSQRHEADEFLKQKSRELFEMRVVRNETLNTNEFQVLNHHMRIELSDGIEIMPPASADDIFQSLKQGRSAFKQKVKKQQKKRSGEAAPTENKKPKVQPTEGPPGNFSDDNPVEETFKLLKDSDEEIKGEINKLFEELFKDLFAKEDKLTKWFEKLCNLRVINNPNHHFDGPATSSIVQDGDDAGKIVVELNPYDDLIRKLFDVIPTDNRPVAAEITAAAWMVHDRALFTGGLSDLVDMSEHMKRAIYLSIVSLTASHSHDSVSDQTEHMRD